MSGDGDPFQSVTSGFTFSGGAAEDLLEAGYTEHEQVAAIDDRNVQPYNAVSARVLLLGGSNSPPFMIATFFAKLTAAIPNSTSEVIDSLDHLAPIERHRVPSLSVSCAISVRGLSDARIRSTVHNDDGAKHP